LLLVHVPLTFVRDVILPAQVTPAPVMDAGSAFTVTSAVFVQPEDVYVTIAVPSDTPLTTPVVLPTEAIPLADELHVPADGVLPNVVVAPIHTLRVPVIGEGIAFTVTIVVSNAAQPEPTV
jgi:hypothetical protein